jgi:hypothetical protein
MHLMELLGDVDHVESCFFLFGDIVSAMQDGCMVCARHGIGLEIVLDTLDGTTKVTRLRWKLILVLLDIMLILTQNRCTGCVKCTIDS